MKGPVEAAGDLEELKIAFCACARSPYKILHRGIFRVSSAAVKFTMAFYCLQPFCVCFVCGSYVTSQLLPVVHFMIPWLTDMPAMGSQMGLLRPINLDILQHSKPSMMYKKTVMSRVKTRQRCACNVTMRSVRVNHCCCGKAISVTYSECVSVALGIQRAMRMRHSHL
jgi:hypothetical protein